MSIKKDLNGNAIQINFDAKVKSALVQRAVDRISDVPSPEKIPQQEERPLSPKLEKKNENNFKEKNTNFATPKALDTQAKLKSNDFFLQRRKEKFKEKSKAKDSPKIKEEIIPQMTIEDDLTKEEREKERILREMYKRASLAVQIDDNVANLEEIKGLERDTLEGNKVMVEWINKNKSSLEKSQKIEPILKKKDILLETNFEEMEKRALKKIEEKISSYLAVSSQAKEIENIHKKIESPDSFKNEKKVVYENNTIKTENPKKSEEPKIEKVKNAEEHRKFEKNKIAEEIPKNKTQKTSEEENKKTKTKFINKKPLQRMNNLKNNDKTLKIRGNLDSPSPEARDGAAKCPYHGQDIKRSKTPTYEQQQKIHKNVVLRAKTPEYKNLTVEKYFISKNKLESSRNNQKININEQNNLDNYTDEKFYQISNNYDDSINDLTVKSLQVSLHLI